MSIDYCLPFWPTKVHAGDVMVTATVAKFDIVAKLCVTKGVTSTV